MQVILHEIFNSYLAFLPNATVILCHIAHTHTHTHGHMEYAASPYSQPPSHCGVLRAMHGNSFDMSQSLT